MVLHAADDVSISSLIQINAAVSIHQWISIQSPAVEELIPLRGAEHPHHPTGGADDWHFHWANRSWREGHITVTWQTQENLVTITGVCSVFTVCYRNKNLHRDSTDSFAWEWDLWRTWDCNESDERVSVPSTITWRSLDVSVPDSVHKWSVRVNIVSRELKWSCLKHETPGLKMSPTPALVSGIQNPYQLPSISQETDRGMKVYKGRDNMMVKISSFLKYS